MESNVIAFSPKKRTESSLQKIHKTQLIERYRDKFTELSRWRQKIIHMYTLGAIRHHWTLSKDADLSIQSLIKKTLLARAKTIVEECDSLDSLVKEIEITQSYDPTIICDLRQSFISSYQRLTADGKQRISSRDLLNTHTFTGLTNIGIWPIVSEET